MKRLELLALQIFAVVCSYLILSITFASALEIKIYTPDDQEFTGELSDFSDFIQKSFQYPYLGNRQYMEIILSSRDPSYNIKKVYLFRCKNLNPVECIQTGIEPVISVSQGGSSLVFDETYRWDDVSSNNIGNFLTFVKLDVGGKEVWTGSWDKLTKTGIRKFHHANYDMDKLDVYLKSGVSGENVKSYIEDYHSLPSDSINYSVFESIIGTSVEKLYDLSGDDDEIDPSGTGIPDFYTSTSTGKIFGNSLKTWDFVFGGDGKTASPVVFYSTGTGGPPVGPAGGPNLVIDNLSPQVATCSSDEVIQANMHVDNASDIGYFQSYYYEIDGVKGGEGSITCSIINLNASIYSYKCSVPVANFPACSAEQSILTFHFNYQGGVQLSTTGFPITLNSPEPKLIVNSVYPSPFDCGLDTELTSQLQVLNPTEVTPETHYTFDGTNFNALECSGSGSLYTCEIPENDICPLLQENLELTFKFVYDDLEVLSLPTQLFVTFPPPNLGIDTVTPQTVEAGETTSVDVLLHVNYPDFITFNENDFNFKYLNKGFQSVNTCSLDTSYTNIKYYKCTIDLEMPSDEDGAKTLTFRLDGYMDGEPKQLTANTFFETLPPPPEATLRILSTSSPLDCIQDPSLTVNARVENMEGTPETTHYSVDSGQTYNTLTCSPSGSTYTCSIQRDDLCGLMSNVLTLTLKFVYPGKELISNPQKVYLEIPEPHIQVYSIQPDTLSTGEKTSVMVNLYIQYPEMLGENPVFLYSYSGKTDQISCTKVSSTSIRDFYECANTEFEIPDDYSGSRLPVVFSVQGTTLSFPMNIPVTDVVRTLPWMEIVSTTPSRIDVSAGNQTSASFYVTVHNADIHNLKHQATLISGSWVSSGTCEEAEIDYDFRCNATISVPGTATVGFNTVTLTLKVSNSKTFDISDTTNVYVLPEETLLEIQSMSPDKLYCEGNQQQNPSAVKITARVKNLADFEVVEEDMSFNGLTISHTARYCTSQGQTITCEIPTDKFLEKVTCGEGDLAPGEGSHYYPLTLTFLIESGGELVTVSGSRDVSMVARPLEPYIQIDDNGVVDGVLQSTINCLGSQTIELGDTGHIRIMYADLLHVHATEDDLEWSFRLDAHDGQGKLTKGMGVSPEANATICRLREHQMMGVHRIEDYECSFYTSTGMFQRCANGDGELILTATSGGKKAEARVGLMIEKDNSSYQIEMEIVTEPMKEIECQIQGQYGEGVKCSLASHSNQNVTIRLYNRNQTVGLTNPNLYNFDISLTGTGVDADLRTIGNCRKESEEANKYICPFQIGPAINLPETSGYNVTKDHEQTFEPISMGTVNITVYVKYASGLARAVLSRMDGDIKIQPKKSNAMINAEKMTEKMKETFKSFEDIFKWVVAILSFCAICSAGNRIVDSVEGAIRRNGDSEGAPGAPETPEETEKPPYEVTCTEACDGSNYCRKVCDGPYPLHKSAGDAQCKTADPEYKCCCQVKTCQEACGGAISSCRHSPGFCSGGDLALYHASDGDDFCKKDIPGTICCCGVKTCQEACGGYYSCLNNCNDQYPGHKSDGDDFCKAKTDYSGSTCCCKSTAGTESSSPDDYQPETGVVSFEEEKDTAGGDIIALLISAATAYFLAVSLTKMTGLWPGEEADTEEEENEIMKYMKRGLFWGFTTCVVPRIVGDLGGWIAPEGSDVEKGFGVVSAIGSGMSDVCNILTRLLPVVMMFIQFYISYLRFEMCMEMLEIQIEASAMAAARSEGVYQAQAGAQAGIGTMNSMMNCFNQLMQAMNQLTMTSIFLSAQLGTMGGGQTSITYYHGGKNVENVDKICGKGTLKVDAYNYCKGGAPEQTLNIEGTGCGDHKNKQCTYSMPMMPTYGSYSGGYYSGSQQYSGEIHGQISTSGCADGTTITVTVTGVKPRTKVFTYYKDESECNGGEGGDGEAEAGEECNGKKCQAGLICCYTTFNDVTITGKKHCVNNAIACKCIYQSAEGVCRDQAHKNADPENCDAQGECPNGYYCCKP
ncbi:MAG: hypothetical protein V3U72_01270 [Candidatus Aenigmarchaeota archaeon]